MTKKQRKILFIAPIPPPTDGQSKASKVLYDKLVFDGNEVNLVNLSKSSLKNGLGSIGRISQMFRIFAKVWKHRKGNDLIFLSLAESFVGNMRDMLIYFIFRRNLNRLFVQMLGGAGMKEIMNGGGWQTKLNTYFLRRVGGIIVEGPANYEMFGRQIDKDKIHIVPNFAEDYLFLEDIEIEKKFDEVDPLHLLYLSNLITGKGYLELAQAYRKLDQDERSKLQVSFVGGFEDSAKKEEFDRLIHDIDGLVYLGAFIDGEEKRNLYAKSHLFCLPTYYPYEGQPISILEAYASGCVVITTDHSGIPYIFEDLVNGFMVEKRSVDSLLLGLRVAINQRDSLIGIAFRNRDIARSKYRVNIYQNRIAEILKSAYKLV